MKTSILWILVLLMTGAAAFGFYKSLELTQENEELGVALVETQGKLAATQGDLTMAQSRLSEMLTLKEQLAGEVTFLKDQVAERDEKIVKFQRYARLAKERIQDVSEANMELASRQRVMSEQMMRLNLENDEMKRQLSSPEALKQALRDLKAQRRAESARPRRTERRPSPAAEAKPVPAAEAKPVPAAEAKPVPAAQVRTRVVPATESIPESEAKPVPAAEAKPVPAAEAKPVPAAEAKPVPMPVPETTVNPAVETEPSGGNGGYIVRDGRSTFFDLVDIQVRPAESLSVQP